jgi:hypothetical protein
MFRVRKVLFLLSPLLLLLPGLLIVCLSPGTFTQPLSPSGKGGLGGAFGATSYTLDATPTPAPPAMYGASGKNGACLGTSGQAMTC